MAAKKTNKVDIMFRIDQLRQDKMVYMVESLALTFLAFLFYVTVPAILPTLFGPLGDPVMQRQVVIAVFSIPALYWVYVVMGNIMRFKQIKLLEKEL